LTLQTPESFWERFHIEVRIHHAATAIDTTQKTVTVQCMENGNIYTESYDKLILSPGAKAVLPNFLVLMAKAFLPYGQLKIPIIFVPILRGDTLKQRSCLVGIYRTGDGGESDRSRYRHDTASERKSSFSILDYDMACQVHAYLRSKGLDLQLNETVTEFVQQGRRIQVRLHEKRALEAELVILAVGVIPETDLAKAAGLKLGIKDSIVVNEQMQTSNPDIYAVGDAVEVTQFVTGKKTLISLAGPANSRTYCSRRHLRTKQYVSWFTGLLNHQTV
jgi:NADPH-dependent 2,4-dienoyl-CoA reductase/sulfur reductase-like enzyme